MHHQHLRGSTAMLCCQYCRMDISRPRPQPGKGSTSVRAVMWQPLLQQADQAVEDACTTRGSSFP